ncbi:MAG TPA: sigma-70 family RNA polymerase sigma factor [Clostridia bacterium]|nr:sigma-70 family RNA polymerase sigma factor [Clostridia bacterium]
MLIYLQAIEGEEERSKFEQLYFQYRGLMYHVAMKILNNSHSAEDAVHQAFLSIIENLKKIPDVKCLKTRSYIVIIVERKAIDIIRANSKIVDIDFEDKLAGITIPLPGDSDLADAMAMLPARYREVLLLHYDNGFNTKEIAKMLNMKLGSVQKLLWRAKESLQKQMEKEDDSN